VKKAILIPTKISVNSDELSIPRGDYTVVEFLPKKKFLSVLISRPFPKKGQLSCKIKKISLKRFNSWVREHKVSCNYLR